MSDKRYNREDCLVLIKNKYQELQAQGLTRYPQRSDFDEREVVAIKAFLGPWPRALEAAGVKPPRDDDHQQRNREKRIRAKQNRRAAMRRAEQEKKNPNVEEKSDMIAPSVRSYKAVRIEQLQAE